MSVQPNSNDHHLCVHHGYEGEGVHDAVLDGHYVVARVWLDATNEMVVANDAVGSVSQRKASLIAESLGKRLPVHEGTMRQCNPPLAEGQEKHDTDDLHYTWEEDEIDNLVEVWVCTCSKKYPDRKMAEHCEASHS